MRVIAARSRASAGLIETLGMEADDGGQMPEERNDSPSVLCRLSSTGHKKAPRLIAGAPRSKLQLNPDLAPVAQQPQQEQEQVDEVEIEGECAHHGLAADEGAV